MGRTSVEQTVDETLFLATLSNAFSEYDAAMKEFRARLAALEARRWWNGLTFWRRRGATVG